MLDDVEVVVEEVEVDSVSGDSELMVLLIQQTHP